METATAKIDVGVVFDDDGGDGDDNDDYDVDG